MNIKVSPFLKDMIATTVTSIATVLSFILVTRMLAEGLGPEGFGSYSLARRVLSTLEPLSTFNMGIAVSRYAAINRDDKYGYLFSGLLFGLFSSTLLLALAFIFRNGLTVLFFQNQDYTTLLLATFLLVLGYSCFVILYGFYRGAGKIWAANIWQLILIAVVPFLIAKKYAYRAKADWIILLYALSFFIIFIPIMYYLLRALFHKKEVIIKKHRLAELFRYGFFRIPGFFAYGGILAIGTFMSPYIGTLKSAGYLMVGLSVIKIVEGGIDSFGRVVLPKAAYFFAVGQKPFLKERVIDITNFIVHIGLYLSLHIILWADQIVPLWLGRQYLEAVPLISIFSIAIVPFLIYSMLRSIIDATEVKAINARNLYISFGITTLACLLFAILGFGIIGLAIGTILGIFALGLLTLRYLRGAFQIKSFNGMFWECVLINIVFIMAGFVIKENIVVRLSSSALICAGAIAEACLFCMYCLTLNFLNTRWIAEIKKRIAIGKNIST